MKRLFFRSDGTVTLFCALIMTSLIVFFMVLIDFCRLLLFDRTTESAVRLAAQSVISAYDEQMYREFGLFVRGGTESEALFRETISFNLGNTLALFSKEQGIDFAASSLDDVVIYSDQFIGQHHVFEAQVLDDMKYRAPIDFTFELLDQWSSLKDGVEKSTAMINVLDELNGLYEQREELLEEAYDMQKQLGQVITSQITTLISTQADPTITRYSSYIRWVKARDSIIEQITDLGLELHQNSETLTDEQQESIREKINDLWDDVDDYNSSIQSYKSTANKFIKSIEQRINAIEDKLVIYEGSSLKINKALAINNTMKIKYDLHLGSNSSTPTTDSSELSSELNSFSFDSSLIRSVAQLQTYRDEAEILDLEVKNIVSELNTFALKIDGLTSTPNTKANIEQIKTEASQQSDSLKQLIKNYVSNYDNTGSKMLRWSALLNEQQDVKKQLKEQEQQFEDASKELEQMKKLLKTEVNIDEINQKYDQLEQRYKQIERHNQQLTPSASGITTLSGSSRKQARAATTRLTDMFDLFSHGLSSIRDRIYINEYALNRFSSFPYREIKINELSKLDPWLDISKQEVEYIIYGFHEPLVNVGLAFGEIFAIRFAIRTIEGLIANRALTHPLIILAAAVVHGIRYAIDDMNDLIRKGSTKLSKYAPIDVSYHQYLRLLLLIHPSKHESKLSRMLALIEGKTGQSTLQLPTSITAEAQISMNLWAIPGIAQLTNRISGVSSEVDGNVYKKTKMVTASY